MKKSLLAAAVLSAVSFGAYADGVELYGIIDLAVVNESAGYSADATFPSGLAIKGGVTSTQTQSLTAMVSGGIQGSRWGIKGSEDLGDGMKAIFQLESGIQANNGNLSNGYVTKVSGTSNGDASSVNGQLFGRTAWAGLSDKDLGEIRFGRQYSVIYDVYNDYDPVQFAALFSPTGNSGTIAGGGRTELSRQDNSIKYIGKSGDINYSLMYKLGNISGSSSAGSVTSARVEYKHGQFGLSAAYQSAIDAVGYSASTTGYAANVTSYIVAAKYKFNDNLNGKAAYQRVTYNNPSDTFATGTSLAVSATNPYVYSGAYSFTSITPRSVGSSGFNVTSLGGDYKFSSNLALHAGYYVVNYDAAGGAAINGAANDTGFTENYASLLLDYNLSKRTDVYFGAINVSTNQTKSISTQSLTTKSGITVAGAGLRVKF